MAVGWLFLPPLEKSIGSCMCVWIADVGTCWCCLGCNYWARRRRKKSVYTYIYICVYTHIHVREWGVVDVYMSTVYYSIGLNSVIAATIFFFLCVCVSLLLLFLYKFLRVIVVVWKAEGRRRRRRSLCGLTKQGEWKGRRADATPPTWVRPTRTRHGCTLKIVWAKILFFLSV